MMKRILSIVLSIVMLVGLLPTTALASGDSTEAKWGTSADSLTNEGTVDEAFEAANADGSTVGYIQLQKNATMITSPKTNNDMTLDLQDYVLSFSNNATITASQGTLNLHNGTIKRAEADSEYMIIAGEDGILNVENVTLDGGAVWIGDEDSVLGRGTTNSGITAHNVLLYVRGTATLNEGTVLQNNQVSSAPINGSGGAVTVFYGGSLTINDGVTIRNNENPVGSGGAIKAYRNSSIVMNGGDIYGNAARDHGGAIQIIGKSADQDLTTFTMNGGTIRNNRAGTGKNTAVGGAIAVSDYSKFVMTGGSITDNTTTGTKGGGVSFSDGNTAMELSNSAVIIRNTANGVANNLYIGDKSNNKVTVGAMVGEDSVGITMANPGTFSDGGASYASCFFSDDSTYTVAADGDDLKLAEPSSAETHSHDMSVECGSTDPVTFTAWDGTGTPSGNVYLTDNVTLTESLIISSGTVNLCLNGHTITITNSQDAFYVESGATLNICECSTNQSGKIEKTSASADYPGILNRGGTVNVYSGTVSSSNNSNGSNGIYNHSGTVNVYSGTVSSSKRYGINNRGTVNVYGGTVTGSRYGICNSYGGSVTVSGGTVKSTGTDGNNYGIYNYYHGAGSLELSGAPTITGATAGVYLDGGIITLGGELSYTQGNAISVLMETPGTFTSGWTEKMGENADYDSYFTAWDDGYTVQPDGSGELKLAEKPPAYTVTVTANPTGGGTVTGSGTYEEGSSVTLMATANPGYKFVNWTMNGTEVNTDATYSFTATENAEYVANFVESHTHCICGETHKAIGTHTTEENPTWVAISSADDFTKNKDSGYYYLTNDIEVSAKWEFTKSRDIVLCLNGYDITYTGSSNVSFIPGSTNLNFTLTDCKAEAGSISGFKNINGGAINVKKTFTMYNGKITGNTATQGGGVYVDQPAGTNAIFYMYGGEITGNTASSLGGGVFIKGAMEVAGAPVVNNNENSNTGTSYQNKMSAFTKNIYSSNDAVVVGTGGLTAGAKLDVTPKFPVSSSERPTAVATIATGCTSDLSAYFTYTSGFNYTKQYDATEGKVQLVYAPVKYTVTFNMQGHGTQVEEQSVETDTYATEPSPAPTAQGYTFGGWYTTPECGYWDDFIFDFFKITEDKTLYAKWTLNAPAISGAEGYTADYDGASHEINVTVDSVSNLSYSYQWYKDGKAEENEIDSATSATYSVKNVADSGTYYCKVTVSDGSSTNSGWSDAVTVAIAKVSVAVPVISSKAYTGNTLTADITDTADYTVTTNNGGVSAGSYEVVLTLNDSTNYKWADSNDEAKTLEFAITKAGTNTITGLSIANWTYGETPNAPTAAATFGAPAFTYVGTGSTVYAESATAPTNAGTYKVIAKVADTENHVGASDEAEFVIAKANPSYTIPTGLNATYGDTLADVTLPTGWTWKDADTTGVGNAGTNSFVAIYTPDDTANYNTAEATVSVAVSKANPEYTAPTGLNATYGNTLADVDLPDGWSWKDEITTSVGNAGTNDFVATFTPADVDNYNTAEATVSIAVAKANPSYTIPTGLTATYGNTLANVTLPNGWSWKDATTTSVGNAGTKTFAAVFTPDDTDNYNTVEADLEVNVVRQKVAKPAENTTVFTYNGNEQIYTLTENARYEITNNKRTDAGEQTVTVTLNDKHNYRWDDNTTDDVTFTFTIAQKEIGIVWGTTQFTYNKTEQKPTATATGLVTGDSCEIAVTGGQTNAGNGYVATAKSLSNANYKLPTSKTTTFNIAQKSVAITGITIEATKVYDRETNAVITNYGIVSNVIDGDIVTVNTASATATYNDANVGNGKAVAFAGFAITGADAENYALSSQPESQSANITPKPVTITGATVTATKVYDANTTASIESTGSVAGVISGDAVDVNSSSATAVYSDANIGTDKTITFAGFAISGADASNYELSAQPANTTANITAKDIAGAVITLGESLTYNGNEQTQTIASATVDGLTITYEVSGNVNTNAGDYTLTITGNENFTGTAQKAYTIAKRDATLETVPSAITPLTYNAAEQTLVSAGENVVGGTLMYKLGDGEYSAELPKATNAGSYTVYYKVIGDSNHNDTEEQNFEVTISQKVVSPAIVLTTPVPNQTPVTNIETDEYTATIAWSPDVTDKFAYSTDYTATITITPKDNYTLTGVTENGYTIEGATVTNPADSGVITAVFPKTSSRPSSGGGTTRYTVKFDTDGGSEISSKTVTRNSKVAEPTAPEKEGYTFMGWYSDKELTEKYDFDSKVTKNLTLYAKWDKHDDEQPGTDTHNCPSLAFDDLDITKWYHFDTDYVIENGIFKGTTETSFEPDSAQTRAMMVTVLYRVEGEPAVNRSIPFADVDMGAYYANAVIWGQQNGIIKGYSETEFGPDDKITREQIAAIMHRYAQYKGYDVSVGENTNILSYDDFDIISEYAIPSMQWAVGSGLIKGKSESTLNPLDNATRAEIAAILHRFIEANLISTQN